MKLEPSMDWGLAATTPCRGRSRGVRTLTTLYDVIAGLQDRLGPDDAAVVRQAALLLRAGQATLRRLPRRILWEVVPAPSPAGVPPGAGRTPGERDRL